MTPPLQQPHTVPPQSPRFLCSNCKPAFKDFDYSLILESINEPITKSADAAALSASSPQTFSPTGVVDTSYGPNLYGYSATNHTGPCATTVRHLFEDFEHSGFSSLETSQSGCTTVIVQVDETASKLSHTPLIVLTCNLALSPAFRLHAAKAYSPRTALLV
jgi:hypothetical protein